jgi:hypothetical protein
LKGEPNKVIARQLGLAEGTVKIHIAGRLLKSSGYEDIGAVRVTVRQFGDVGARQATRTLYPRVIPLLESALL